MKEFESTFFYAIILSFSLALLLNGPAYTGMITGIQQNETIFINEIYSGYDILNLNLAGNVSSIRISGEFIGNGTGIIKANNLILIDSRDFEKKSGNLITGLVVDDVEVINPTNIELNESVNETINNNNNNNQIVESNVTNDVVEILVNETNNSQTEIINDVILPSNVSIQNLTDDINLSQEINFTQEVNITSNSSIENNISQIIIEEFEQRISFNEYCKDTCLTNENNSLTLIIALENLKLNLTSITYTYVSENVDVVNELNLTQNNTLPISQNISSNYSVNLTNVSLNLSQNITLNYSLNLSNNITNVSLNLTLINLTNVSLVNITNITQINITNISQINITNISYLNLSDIKQFNYSLYLFNLLYFEPGLIKLGYEKNILTINSLNSSLVESKIYKLNDDRITSLAFFINNTISTEFIVETDSADVILKCAQFTNNTCKKWQETNTSFVFFNRTTSFTVFENGIYSVGKIEPKKVTKIPTNSVYLNSDCEFCPTKYVCDADIFCVMQNAVQMKTTYTAQLDFDIFGLNESWFKTEVCAYKSYSTEDVVNYVKYSPESFCSDINNGNSTSDLISYALLDRRSEIDCIDASEIVRFAQNSGYSNVFIDWIGQDLNGANYPFNCYLGLDSEKCSNDSEGGCLPYLKISYK